MQNQSQEKSLASEIELCNRRQHDYDGIEAPLWLHMLGYADWEAEKVLIQRENFTQTDHESL